MNHYLLLQTYIFYFLHYRKIRISPSKVAWPWCSKSLPNKYKNLSYISLYSFRFIFIEKLDWITSRKAWKSSKTIVFTEIDLLFSPKRVFALNNLFTLVIRIFHRFQIHKVNHYQRCNNQYQNFLLLYKFAVLNNYLDKDINMVLLRY